MGTAVERAVPSEVLDLPTTESTVMFGRVPAGTPLADTPCQMILNRTVATGRDIVFLGLEFISQKLSLSPEAVLKTARGPTIIYGAEKKLIKACRFFTEGEEWLFICTKSDDVKPFNPTKVVH
jgi:hypothetical protein